MTDSEKIKARERILIAAASVFAEQGMKGATTREIARTAAVNETTLFRHFQNKELLFKAVVEKAATRISEALSGPGMSNNDLYKDLMYYAVVYNRVLEENEPLVRMLLGEARRQKEEARLIAFNVWKPIRESLVDYLDKAKEKEQIRKDVDTNQAVDVLKAMILGHLFRRGTIPMTYSTEQYLQTALDIFIRGISRPGSS